MAGRFFPCTGCRRRLLACGLLLVAWGARAAELPAADAAPAEPPGLSDGPPAGAASGKILLDETVISGNQELPKVLYIVPWQSPNGLPDIQLKTDFAEEALFRRLYPPAYRREMSYFEKLQIHHPEE